MGSKLTFNYYYGAEAEQFSFFRVPKLFVKDERFKGLSSDAKLLYGLMLDRMGLSMKNGWFDKENRAYIHYTLDNIMEDLGCGKEKAVKILNELDVKNGIGLIEKKRQGLGKPDIIYVKNFVISESNDNSGNHSETPENSGDFDTTQISNFLKFENRTSRSSENGLLEVRKSNLSSFGNQTSRSSGNKPLEVRESNSNNTDAIYTEGSNTYPINQSLPLHAQEATGTIDGMDQETAYIELIKKNIDYDLMTSAANKDRDYYEELFMVICDVVCVKRKTIVVGKEEYPYELVKARFLKLDSTHLDYVIGCMKNTVTKIANIKSYMITALYNAPSTINHYYQQEVQYDLYG